MRILILGDKSDVLDEGAKNVANNLYRELAKRHVVLRLYQRHVLRISNLAEAVRFRPDLVLSVQGPSAKTILLLFFLRVVCGFPHTAAIGVQPNHSNLMLRLMRIFPPSLVFAQSQRWIGRFQSAGQRVERLPNGVDVDKFRPGSDPGALASIRAELGVPEGRKLALHIGPVNINRNHELLARLQQETDWQVVVVGSMTAPYVEQVASALKDAGVILEWRYFADINLVYAAADAYVFPVTDESGSIEFPLTVLEAMACDRPVVTTRFLALPEYLEEGPALRYFSDYEGLVSALSQVAGNRGNREQALGFSWEAIVNRIEDALRRRTGMG
jgi:glycosyltransferase involved in cell wall biosynthesis